MIPSNGTAFERLRREAKRFLKELRRGDEAAIRRYAHYWPAKRSTDEGWILARAQLVIARENGYRSWSHLKPSLLAQERDGEMADGVSTFLQKLVAMLDAGQPLVSSLRELGASEETAPALRPIAKQAAEDVLAGSTFSGALAKHPTVFDPAYMAMVQLFENEMHKAGGPVDEAPAS